MKKLIFIMSLCCLSVLNSIAQTKLFNNPDNYNGSFPDRQDTLYIDYGKGQMLELNYDWYEIFNPSKKASFYKKNLLTKLDLKCKIIQEKIQEISFKDDTKYHIIMERKIVPDDSYLNEERDSWKEKKALEKEGYNTSSIDSIQIAQKKAIKKKMIEKYGEEFENKIYGALRRGHISLKIKERKVVPEEREYILKKGQLYNKMKWQHIVEIRDFGWKAKFYVTNLDQVNNFDFDLIRKSLSKESDNYIQNKYYKHFARSYYIKEGSEIRHLRTLYRSSDKRPKFTKFCIDFSVGSSITKGELSVDATCGAGICLNEELPYESKIKLRTQLKSFGINHQIRNNLFLDAFLELNLKDLSNKEHWMGAGFGYLAKREGDFYGKDTGRAFLKYTFSKQWGIQPELNYSFHDKKAMLSLGFFFNL